MTVRTRFAPSPTGYLHIGGARTALFCWLFARRHEGAFVLRVEDTDRERSTEEAVQVILDGMRWLGLDWDEGPFYQTQRFDSYKATVQKLLDTGQAYHCYCTSEELDAMRAEQRARGEKPKYDGRCRERTAPREGVEPVVRFRMPLEGVTVVDDQVRGRVEFENRELDDLIIARSDGTPTYNLTVVVDDVDMRITHVIRGDDHLNNTPKQINIYKALGEKVPSFSHIPMILGPDGAKLSKRHGAASVMEYRKEGYLPEAVVNYLVRLGWSHGDQEIFSREEMIRLFDIADVNHSASTLNPGKLDWINQHYIMARPAESLVDELIWQFEQLGIEPVRDRGYLARIIASQQPRAKTLLEMAGNSLFFFGPPAEYEPKAARKHLTAEAGAVLERVAAGLEQLESWDTESIHALVAEQAEQAGLKLGKVAQPIRIAVSGGPVSPPIDQTLAILGREETLSRLRQACEWIASEKTLDID
jgi:glutamyl-tRNA synthetase